MNLDDLLREMCEHQASDIYLIPGAIPAMNCDGVFLSPQAAGERRLKPGQTEEFARSIMSPKQWEDFARDREANLAYLVQDIGRFRVNVLWQRGAIGLVMRRVVMEIPSLKALGLMPVLREIALADRGIVLVTGATGSGKSSTMASMIDYRNRLRNGHIVTIEDPIEFVYQHRRSIVTQREVGIDTPSFEEALKNTLRQAPQVISIGELRDSDTVQFALHAAETGHLVFATLHSTNSSLAVERVVGFFPQAVKTQVLLQLSLNIKAILCQRLIPRVGGGRACASEILINTPRLQDLIAKGDMGAIKMAVAAENQAGIQNFDKALFKLCKRGLITEADALQGADSANDLSMKFKGIGFDRESSWSDLKDPWAGIEDDYAPPQSEDPAAAAKYQATTYTNEHAGPISPRGVGSGHSFPAVDFGGSSSSIDMPMGGGGAGPEAGGGRRGAVADRYRNVIEQAIEETDLDSH